MTIKGMLFSPYGKASIKDVSGSFWDAVKQSGLFRLVAVIDRRGDGETIIPADQWFHRQDQPVVSKPSPARRGINKISSPSQREKQQGASSVLSSLIWKDLERLDLDCPFYRKIPAYQSFYGKFDYGSDDYIKRKLLDYTSHLPSQGNQSKMGINLLFSKGQDTVALVHWHPDRIDCLDDLLRLIRLNKADILFHCNNLNTNDGIDRGLIQMTAQVDMENLALENDYQWIWVLHSDVLPPPYARSRLQSHDKDIVTAVVPRPIVGPTRVKYGYLGFEDFSRLRHRDNAPPHLFLYNLVGNECSNPNPTGRVLPSSGLHEIAGCGFGCLMLKREVVQKGGYRIHHQDTNYFIDVQWSYYIRKQGFRIWVDTDIRCRHLHSPVNHPQEVSQVQFINDWITEDWYGWSLKTKIGFYAVGYRKPTHPVFHYSWQPHYETCKIEKLEDIDNVDIYYQLSFHESDSSFLERALELDKFIILHWLGFDIYRFQKGLFKVPEGIDLHLCQTPSNKKELLELGIDAFICPTVPEHPELYTLNPLGSAISVHMPNSGDFYYYEVIKELAKRMPDQKFILYAARHKLPDLAPNCKAYQWIESENELIELLKKSKAHIRLSKHDGMPHSIIQHKLMGRQVISNHYFPGCHQVEPDPILLEQTLRQIETSDLDEEGSEYYRSLYSPTKFIERFENILTYPKASFTTVTLNSRNNFRATRAIDSAFLNNPDEYLILLDSQLAKDSNWQKYLNTLPAKVILQGGSGFQAHLQAWLRALVEEVKNQWAVQCDDDDEIHADIRKIINQFAGERRLGAIHGLKKFRDKEPSPMTINNIPDFKAGKIYNILAVRDIAKYLVIEPWFDFQIAFWMIKKGYKILEADELISLCHLNHNPPLIRKQYGQKGWDSYLKILEERYEHFYRTNN